MTSASALNWSTTLMTPEGKVKAQVDAALRHFGAYKHKPVQNGMGEPALDYHGCFKGFYVGIETKAKGGKPTPRQQRTMREIAAAGGSLFLIDRTDGDDIAQLIGWLMNPIPGFTSATARTYLNESRDDRHRDPVEAT
jgi:hypothetical protein